MFPNLFVGSFHCGSLASSCAEYEVTEVRPTRSEYSGFLCGQGPKRIVRYGSFSI